MSPALAAGFFTTELPWELSHFLITFSSNLLVPNSPYCLRCLQGVIKGLISLLDSQNCSPLDPERIS